MSHETDPLVIDIPDALRHLKCWFNWRWAVQPDGTKFKLPVQPTGKPASSTGRETWYPYERAAQAANNFEGLAIGLGHWIEPEPNAPRSTPGEFEWGVAGIDLDGAMEDGGGLKPWAAEILARVDSYAEYSPSGKGIHILVITDGAILPGIKLNLSETEHVEFYSTARYFTFTGNHVPGTPDDLKPREAVYTALRAEFEARRPSSARSRSVRRAEKPATVTKADEQRVTLTDEELLFKAQSGPSGEAFKRLYEGDMADYREDHSAADMALAGRLAFWTGKDPEQIDRIFRESGLMRAKWDTRRGLSTYGEQTIEIAIDNCEDVYSGGDKATISFVEKLKAKRAAKVAETQKVGTTVKAGHVQDHERGSDKPALTAMHAAETPTNPNVAQPSADKSLGKRIAPERVTNEAVATVEVQRGHMDGAKPTQPSPAAPAQSAHKPGPRIDEDGTKRAFFSGSIIEPPRTLWPGIYDPNMPQPGLFDPVGSVTAAERGQVSEGREMRGIPPVPSRVEQADLFTENGIFTGPVNIAETVNLVAANREALSVIEQNGDGAQENVHPQETVPLPALPDSKPSKASEYVALTDVDYTRVEELEDLVEPTPRVIEDPDGFLLTGVGNFDRFKARYTGQIIFTRSAGWLRWDGRRWALGNEYATRAAIEVTRDMVVQAATDPRLSDERRSALAKFGLAQQNLSAINAMKGIAQDSEPFTMYEIDLDREMMLLNTPSGIVDLKTGELLPHDPDHFMTKITGVEYDPDATSELWDEVIAEATVDKPGLADFLRRAAGYTLTGVTAEDAVFFLHGGGGTAKSTIGESIKTMMGSYGTSMRSEALTAAGNSGHSDDIARLVGARMVITGEADKADKMRDGLFKRLSGGETIDASRKGKTGFNFRPQFKMWFITNTVPALNPDDSGIWRRVYKLPFDIKVPSPDKRIRIALINEKRHQKAILAWAVRGAVEWSSEGLGMPAVVREANELLRRSMDGLADFFEGRCYFNPDPKAHLYTSSHDLMEAYTKWANEDGLRENFRASGRRLGQGAMARGARSVATRRERGYQGLILKEED